MKISKNDAPKVSVSGLPHVSSRISHNFQDSHHIVDPISETKVPSTTTQIWSFPKFGPKQHGTICAFRSMCELMEFFLTGTGIH